MDNDYIRRISDEKLELLLRAKGAVLIEAEYALQMKADVLVVPLGQEIRPWYGSTNKFIFYEMRIALCTALSLVM